MTTSPEKPAPDDLLESFEEYESSEAIEQLGGMDALLEDPYADLEPLEKMGAEALVIAVRQGAQLIVDPGMPKNCAKVTVSSDLMEQMVKLGLYT